MTIRDGQGRHIISAKREFLCCSCMPIFSSCRHELEVTSPLTNEVLGKVKQNHACCKPSFTVTDAAGSEIFQIIKKNLCSFKLCADTTFVIEDLNGQQVGELKKKYMGYVQESYTDADNFELTFPLNLDVKIKAVLLGAVFLLDFMFFENAGSREG